MDWRAWDVRPWIGRAPQIEVVDDRATSDWGHVTVDNIVFEDQPRAPWSFETAVVVRRATEDPSVPGGVVLGEVIGSATGDNSAAMAAATIDLRGAEGDTVVVQCLDTYFDSDWGHLLVDQLVLSDNPAVHP